MWMLTPVRRIFALITVIVLIGGTALAVWAGSQPEEPTSRVTGESQYAVIVPDLCAAIDAAQAGRRTAAYDLFYRRAHVGLHALAAQVDANSGGRELGGRLRRAKSTVETGLLNNTSPLPNELGELIVVTAEALDSVDGPPAQPC
jgi:hypothetical protein